MNIEKYKSGQVGGLIAHDERVCDNHTNEKINPDKLHLNYNLIQEDSLKRYHDIMGEVSCLKRADVNTLVGIAITLPRNVPGDRSEEFFQHCYNFLADRYGKQGNIVSAWIHRDETTDHLHFKFVPVYWNEKKKQLAVSFDKVMPRKEYQTIHKDLEKFIHKHMGIEQAILNGATVNGNKTITELKLETLNEEKNQLENQVKSIEKRFDEIIVEANKIDIKKPKKLAPPEIKKIPFLPEEYVKKTKYDQIANELNKTNEEKMSLANANKALQAKNNALESQNKSLGSSTLVKHKKALESDNLRLRSELNLVRNDLEQATAHLQWYEKFYQAVLQSFKDLGPDIFKKVFSHFPEQQQKRLQRDLQPPQKKKQISR